MHFRIINLRYERWISYPPTSVSHWPRLLPQFLTCSYFHNCTCMSANMVHVPEQRAAGPQWDQSKVIDSISAVMIGVKYRLRSVWLDTRYLSLDRLFS